MVRNIWRLYGGWWDGAASRLKPAPDSVLGAEIASLAGGADVLIARAKGLAEDGDIRLACHLADFAAWRTGRTRSTQSRPRGPRVRCRSTWWPPRTRLAPASTRRESPRCARVCSRFRCPQSAVALAHSTYRPARAPSNTTRDSTPVGRCRHVRVPTGASSV
ncbi:MAG: alkyl sulfatase dimerization domain-containing protein [Actinomycetota bacterium]